MFLGEKASFLRETPGFQEFYDLFKRNLPKCVLFLFVLVQSLSVSLG